MRLVHLADLHLGHRQFQRLTPAGINQREADVAAAFVQALDRTIELAPEIVLIAGDIFQTVRPPNPAILHAFNHFARLRQSLPQAAIVMIAGNHDLPRTAEQGCILRLFARLGIEVADREARRIAFPALGLSVLAVPDLPGAERPALLPDPEARTNVLMLHGEIEGVIPRGLMMYDRATLSIPMEELHAPRWDYIGLGHYHVHREIAPNAYYAGAIEYTSPNAWGERREEDATGVPGKGIVEYDLAAKRRRFHPIRLARRLLDLGAIDAAGSTAAEIDELIRRRVESASIDDQIVRLVVRDIPRHVVRELDPKPIREYRRRALHFHLDTRKPDVIRFAASGGVGRRPSLIETVTERLGSRSLPSDVDRDALINLAVHYLREVERNEGTPIAALAEGTS